MRIAFDQQVFLLQEYGGISRYVCSLAKELSLIPDSKVKIFAPLHFNRQIGQLSNSDLVWGWRLHSIPKTSRLVVSLSKSIAHLAIRNFHPNIIHETYFTKVDFLPKGSRRVITVYDMIHEKFASIWPGSEVTTEAKKAAVIRADHVICISESTRRDLLELFDVPERKVSVVHIGYDLLVPVAVCDDSLNKLTYTPYLLYVGSRSGYKNFKGLLRAVAASPFLKSNFSIICFGGGGLTKEEMSLINELNLDVSRIKQIGGGDHILARLYQLAAVFVYASLYEGFGIPPLEAMSLGCPVVCSNTSSIPEVVGDAGEYFDPNITESIGYAIESVVQSPARRSELVEKGYMRCAMFSWGRCASETLSIYRGLM